MYKRQGRDAIFGTNKDKTVGDSTANVMFVEELTSLRSGLNPVHPEETVYNLLLDPRNRISAGFIVAAAPELCIKNDGHGDDPFTSWRSESLPVLAKQNYDNAITNMFWAPKSVRREDGDVDEDGQYDVLVLAPWGCGACQNDPEIVADAFIRIIQRLAFLDKYKEVHFALGRILGV